MYPHEFCAQKIWKAAVEIQWIQTFCKIHISSKQSEDKISDMIAWKPVTSLDFNIVSNGYFVENIF